MQPLEEGDYYLFNQISDSLPESSPQEEQVLGRLSQNDAVQALSAVPHDFRDVVVLVDIGDFSYQDAAQILDIPIGTVMSRLHRGRRILKKELAGTRDGGRSAMTSLPVEDPCDKCEQMLQPYLDRELTETERFEAEQHLDSCAYCRARYRFEEKLRMFVRQAAVETMDPALKSRLASPADAAIAPS